MIGVKDGLDFNLILVCVSAHQVIDEMPKSQKAIFFCVCVSVCVISKFDIYVVRLLLAWYSK